MVSIPLASRWSIRLLAAGYACALVAFAWSGAGDAVVRRAQASEPGPAEASPPASLLVDATRGARENETLSVETGQLFAVMLAANPSTGYGWQLESGGDIVVQIGGAEFRQAEDRLGAPGTQLLRFRAVRAGRAELRLAYRRPWENEAAPAGTFTVELDAVGEPRAIEPAATAERAEQAAGSDPGQPSDKEPAAASDLPAAHNWCDLGHCTPIKDQGRCGSCWAFATVGVLESRILANDGVTRDLAEQYLVSCNVDSWGCDGGWYAHDYHRNKKPSGEPDAGAVYEPNFPYTASDAPCNPPHAHQEKIASWRYVGTSFGVPSTAAIKQAILDHGPVAASVCVGDDFQHYTGGVFTQDEASDCLPNNTNHGVNLVGWDDARGAWRLRNSWGSWWGEGGYMWIQYGVSNVGYAANYVVYGTVAVPPSAPVSLTVSAASSSQLNLSWVDRSADEDGFKIERSPNGLSSWSQIVTLPPNATAYANTGLACDTEYYYRVRSYNAGGESLYSNVGGAATAPCAYSVCLPARALACGETHHGNNGGPGSTDVVEVYSCAGWAETGPEYGYTFTAPVTSAVTVTLSGLAEGVDLDLFVASDAAGRCDSGACLMYADTTMRFRAAPGRTYNLVVDGYNGAMGDYTLSVQCASLIPAAPLTLTAERAGAAIALAWSDSSWNESGFQVERAPAGDGAYHSIHMASANATAYTDAEAQCGTAYQYRVRAFNAEGASAYGPVAQASSAECQACSDSYEPDNSRPAAQALTVAAPPQARNFHEPGDQDWASVALLAGAVYTVTTEPGMGAGTDTIIELYDTDGVTLLAQDDDSGPESGSQIVWTAARDGAHFLRAYQFDGAGACSGYAYQLSVAASGAAPGLWHPVFIPLSLRP